MCKRGYAGNIAAKIVVQLIFFSRAMCIIISVSVRLHILFVSCLPGPEGDMENRLTRKLVLSGLFTALICVITLTVKMNIGTNGAYMNAGDGFIYAAGLAMSGPWAAVAAGIGSMFADLIVGSVIYAPATLIIKGLMGLVVGMALYGRKANWLRYLLFMALASLVMVAGYGVYEYFIYVPHGAQALVNLPFNLIQAGVGVIIGLLLALVIRRVIPDVWLDTFKKTK